MTFEPSLHLHFEISNDCKDCCPRIFRCCRGDSGELLLENEKKLVKVAKTTKKQRTQTQQKLYTEAIPTQIGFETWIDLQGKIEEISQLDFYKEVRKGKPLTKEKLKRIGRAIDQILNDSTSEERTSGSSENSNAP